MYNQKVAVVTGASRESSLGLNLARVLRQFGYFVVATYRTDRYLPSLTETDLGVMFITLDVRQQSSVENLLKQVRERLDRCDLLVYCCGIPALREPVCSAPIYAVVEQLEVHALGFLCVVQAMLPLMNKGGIIVNISSSSASLANMGADSPGYAAAKALSNAIVRQLAPSLRDRGIAVYSLHPGVFPSRIGKVGSPAAIAAYRVANRILSLELEHSGTFLDAASGEPIPW